jgi:hypothetical protein
MGVLKDHNRLMVEGAHQWLVATSDDQLVAVQERFRPAEPDATPNAAQP